jgi:transposase
MHFLTDFEREQLKAQHRQERDGRVRDRIKAVLLYDKQWSPQDIAEALLISDQAVRNHIEDYQTSSKLKPENGGSEEKLSKEQSAQLEAHLQSHTYLYVKDIGAYVQATFDITYTLQSQSESDRTPLKWMKEQVIYNTYYEHFEDFKGAVLGFFAVLSTVTPESIFGRGLRRRVRDKFRPIEAPQSA